MRHVPQRILLFSIPLLLALVVFVRYVDLERAAVFPLLDPTTQCQVSGGLCEASYVTSPEHDNYDFWSREGRIAELGIILVGMIDIGTLGYLLIRTVFGRKQL